MREVDVPVIRFVREVQDGMTRSMAVIRCSYCKATDRRTMTKNLPQEGLQQMFRARGWLIDSRGKEAECPACQERKSMEATPQALRKQRAMFALLDQHYSLESSCYAEGWSDDRIAKETQMSPSAVAAARDAAYGPVHPPELIQAAKDLAELKKSTDEQLAAVTAMLNELKQSTSVKFAHLENIVQKRMGKVA